MRRPIIVLLICLFLVSTASAQTQTELNISNSPPTLIQNIPNILVILDTPNIDAFDLDDYFNDLNGEDLTFTHNTLNNITVTINSENKVSFYPDIGYSGTQSMYFNASDTDSTATSNNFLVTVGLDTEPPQWSNPRKDWPSVYQNYHVTFTTDWTDNVQLKEYIFSINQGIGWQNQTVTPFSGTSNKSNFTVQISASPGTIISWTFYAKDIYDNINKVDTQNFTVKEFTASPGDEGNISDSINDTTQTSDTVGVSYGTGEIKLDFFKEGILAENLEVDTRSIRVSLKQGESTTRIVKIINTGNTNIKIIASLKNMNLFALLGDTTIEISPGETHELLIDFSVPMETMPDQYFGFLLLDYGDQISIPVILDVKEFESEINIDVNLTKKSKAVKIGEDVTALLTIKNLKDISSSSSQLYYAIKNFKGDIIASSTEEINLEELFQEERSLTIPEGTHDGEYIFYARIISEDSIDLDSESFLIGAKIKMTLLFKKFFYPFTILILLLILLILYIIYRRNKTKKQLLELYLLLNELRGLVKEGKTMEAMTIYKRIKLTYGQHVSKGFMQDEPKLREELAKFSKILKETEKKPEVKQPSPEKANASPTKTPQTPTTSPTKIPQTSVKTSTPWISQKSPDIKEKPTPTKPQPKPNIPK